MFVEERQQQILDKLKREGKVLVKDLSAEFAVTPDLIRKDLASLEKRGQLRRAYGGAVPLRENLRAPRGEGSGRSAAKDQALEGERCIAARAESMIQNGEMVFLDISPINTEITRLLIQKDRSVTIVTNSIEILALFTVESRARLIFIGGKLNHTREGFTGAVTIEWLSKYRFDLAFIGVIGVDIARNTVTTYEIDDALTKTSAIKVSRKSYIVTESAGFEREGNCRSASLDDFAGVITDDRLSEKDRKALADKKLDVLIV